MTGYPPEVLAGKADDMRPTQLAAVLAASIAVLMPAVGAAAPAASASAAGDTAYAPAAAPKITATIPVGNTATVVAADLQTTTIFVDNEFE